MLRGGFNVRLGAVFVDALRRHLGLAQQGLLTSGRFPVWLDEPRREAKILEIMEAEEAILGEAGKDRLVRQLERWDGEYTRTLVERLIACLASASLLSGDPERDDATLDAAVRGVLVQRQILRASELWLAGVRGQRFTRCIREADEETRTERSELGSFSTRRYADELQLVRAARGGVTLRPAGEVFLGLRGRDAMRWLLAIECRRPSAITIDGDSAPAERRPSPRSVIQRSSRMAILRRGPGTIRPGASSWRGWLKSARSTTNTQESIGLAA